MRGNYSRIDVTGFATYQGQTWFSGTDRFMFWRKELTYLEKVMVSKGEDVFDELMGLWHIQPGETCQIQMHDGHSFNSLGQVTLPNGKMLQCAG